MKAVEPTNGWSVTWEQHRLELCSSMSPVCNLSSYRNLAFQKCVAFGKLQGRRPKTGSAGGCLDLAEGAWLVVGLSRQCSELGCPSKKALAHVAGAGAGVILRCTGQFKTNKMSIKGRAG